MITLLIIAGIVLIILDAFTNSLRKKSPPGPKKGNQNSGDLIGVHTDTKGNQATMTIELNEAELLRRLKNGKPIGASKREAQIEDITGFFGQENYSPNKSYVVSYSDSYSDNGKQVKGKLALLKGKELLFKKVLQRPCEAQVSNTGVVVCCDYLETQELTGKFMIFDIKGELLFSKKPGAIPGNCAVSADGSIALFETHSSDTDDSDQIFIIDIATAKVIDQFERGFAFNTAVILPDKERIQFINHKNFVYETDYSGEQVNAEAYEKQILLTGSVYDKIALYESRSNEEKYKDAYYLELLEFALSDSDACYSFGKDRIYRKIGEVYEAQGLTEKAIASWEQAIALNPKVGIAQKLERLKKRSVAKDQ